VLECNPITTPMMYNYKLSKIGSNTFLGCFIIQIICRFITTCNHYSFWNIICSEQNLLVNVYSSWFRFN